MTKNTSELDNEELDTIEKIDEKLEWHRNLKPYTKRHLIYSFTLVLAEVIIGAVLYHYQIYGGMAFFWLMAILSLTLIGIALIMQSINFMNARILVNRKYLIQIKEAALDKAKR